MKDNEIIKALECHTGNNSKRCQVCPYEIYGYYCLEHLYPDLLALINRQKAEIERLLKLQKPTGAGGFRIENGKVVFYSDMLNGYRHEYKDLDEIVKELNLYMHTDYKNIELISHYKHKAQTAKSEAIKEFAERLKLKLQWDTEFENTLVFDTDIDNLLKEMEGSE